MCATRSSDCLRVPKPLSLPKSSRILRSSEFREVYQFGFRMSCRYFAAFCLYRNTTLPGRVGFTLPRAIGRAVIRNRIRRRMREAVRSQIPPIPSNWAIVLNPRRAALEASFEDLCRETARVIERCKERS